MEDDLPYFGKPADQVLTSKSNELKKNAKQGFEFFSANFNDKLSLDLSKTDEVVVIKVYAQLIP